MTRTTRRYAAWALVALVLGCWVLAWVLDATSDRPATTALVAPESGEASPPGPVVVIGVPDLDPGLLDDPDAPHLAELGRTSSSAALILRGTHEVSCPPDAWMTLGAGQRSSTDLNGCGDHLEGIPPAAPEDVVERTGDGGAQIDPQAWQRWVDAGRDRPLAPEPGTLAARAQGAGLTCVAAYGPEAALAAADPQGRVGAYRPEGLASAGDGIPDPELVPELFPDCELHLLTGPAIADGRGGEREALDAALGRLLPSLPEDAIVVLAGLGHHLGVPAAEALLIRTPDGATTSLTSAGTRQPALVQLTDLTPTLVGLASGHEVGGDWAGDVVRRTGLTPLAPFSQVSSPLQLAQDTTWSATLSKTLAGWTLGVLWLVVLPPLLLGLALVLAGRRRGAWLVGSAGTVAMAVPVATFLGGLVPWWRSSLPPFVLPLAILTAAGLVATLAWVGPWRRHPLGPAAVVGALTAAVIGGDAILGGRLGLTSVLGVEPVVAGRFYGNGNVGFGIMLGGLLVVMGTVLALLGRRREAALAIALLGGAATVLNAAPGAGADFGGVVPLVVATGLLVLWAAGMRWSWRTLGGLALLGLVAAAAAMVADWVRGPAARTHLGDFVQAVLDGKALGIVARKGQQSLAILIGYPESWLAVVALVLVLLVVRARWARLAPVWAHVGLEQTAWAALAAMAVAWAMNDSGIAIVPMVITLITGAAVTVLARAWLRGESA